jgi:hypothetical protein
MHIPPSTTRHAARAARTALTVWFLAVQTTSDITWSARHAWREHHAHEPARALLRRLVDICRCHLAGALDPRTFFHSDGRGRRRADLDRAVLRQQRALADLRRRHVRMLLRSLGGSADEVEATLTRHWQLTAQDGWMIPLIPDFLATRLRWRDQPASRQIDILPWASNISGIWVVTPAPVRRYLARSHQHELRLYEAYTRHPRHGIRLAPDSQAA